MKARLRDKRAQRHAVQQTLNGGTWSLIGEFTEIESGKRNERPELAKALAACKRNKAKLVIAKLAEHADSSAH